MKITSVVVKNHNFPQTDLLVSISIEESSAPKQFGLLKSSTVNVRSDNAERDLRRIACESMALSGIFYGLKNCVVVPQLVNISIYKIEGQIDPRDFDGVAVAAACAVIINCEKFELLNSYKLDGWILEF